MFKRTNRSPPKVNFTDGVKTPREIYAAYNIMPSLQLHQLRVAAVAQLICDNFKKSLNERDIIRACLFHDMGNIIKSDLPLFPELSEPEGLAYWERVKNKFKEKYGTSEHVARDEIANEVGLSPRVFQLFQGAGFSRLNGVVRSDSFELKVFQYADMRVGPRGILSMGERIAEGRARYLGRKKPHFDHAIDYEKLLHLGRELEQQIFAEATIKPTEINDTSVAPIVEKMWEYEVA